MDRLSLAHLTYGDCNPLTMLPLAAAAGFDEVGLRILPSGPGQPVPVLGLDETLIKDVVHCARDLGLVLSDIEMIRLNDRTEVGSLRPFFEKSALLGGRHVLTAGDDPDRSRLIENFGLLCRLAAEFDMTVDLEFMPWTAVPDVRSARAVVENAGCPNGAVLVDALHYQKCGSALNEIEALPAGMVNYMQLCDGPANYGRDAAAMLHAARHDRLMPGEGDVDLVGLVRAMPKDFVFSVEVPNDALLAELGLEGFIRRAYQAGRAVLTAAGR
jgi:sugar phosphate isomerase/epimerase